MEIEILDGNFAEYRIPEDYEQIFSFMKVITKNVDGIEAKYIRYNIFDIDPLIIKRLFRLTKINIMYFALLDFIYNINPKSIDMYINENISKEKLFLFFKTILEKFPSDATIVAFQNKFIDNTLDKTSLVYWNTFGMATSAKHTSLINLFANVKTISNEVLLELDCLDPDNFEFFEHNGNHWFFKYKLKDLANIVVIFAKKKNIPVEPDFINKINSLIPFYKTDKKYSPKSLYNKAIDYRNIKASIENLMIEEKKALKELDFIWKL